MRSESINAPQDMQEPTSKGFGFYLVILFLLFEYGRPQDKLSVVGAIHPNWILTSLLVIAWFGSGKIRMVANPQIYRIVLMLFLLAFHVPFAHNNFWAFNVTMGFFLIVPYCISIVLFVDSFERLRVFMKCWIFLAIYIAVNGIRGSGIAGSAFLEDENDVALLINMMVPFALCLFIYEKQMKMRLVYLITALLCVAGIVSSGSRGGFVGLIAVLTVIWLASPRKVLSLFLVSVLALGVFVVSDQKYWNRISTIEKTDEGTAKERTDSWHAGWEMFKDHPFGVGPGNFPIWFPDYQPDNMKRSMWGRQAHSLWFTLLPELGIPGLLLFLSLFWLNLRDLWYLRRLSKDNDNSRFAYFLSLAFMASMAGYFVSGTFLSVLYYPHYWYLTAMIVATRKIVENSDPFKSTVLGNGIAIGRSSAQENVA